MSIRKTTLFYAGLIAVASMAIGMVIAARLDLSTSSSAQGSVTPTMNSAPLDGAIGADTFRQIADAQTPMVVNIRTESRRRTQALTDFFGGDEFFRRFFGQPQDEPRDEITEGAGTGFLIDAEGYILTNNHVVEDATKIEVGLFGDDGNVYEAEIVGRDPLTDSALIRLTERPEEELPEAKFGDSDQIRPGDWVMAIGNPFNLAHTVTVGVISAVGRPFPVAAGRFQQVLQTDAAINPGNSGGPLLNLRGEVVGINTAIISGQATPSNLGIGFAVPINVVRQLLPQLREGRVSHGRIGVQITAVRPEAVEAFGLSDRNGAVVTTVEEGGPADRAGLEPGDVIIEFDGQSVEDTSGLVQRVLKTAPGTTIPLTIVRNRQRQTLDITIAELNLEQEAGGDDAEPENASTGFGMTLNDLTPQLSRRLRAPDDLTGAVVTDVERRGAAARGGVQPGDVILEVNRQPVPSAREASSALQQVQPGQAAFLLVWRRGQEVFLTVPKDD